MLASEGILAVPSTQSFPVTSHSQRLKGEKPSTQGRSQVPGRTSPKNHLGESFKREVITAGGRAQEALGGGSVRTGAEHGGDSRGNEVRAKAQGRWDS